MDIMDAGLSRCDCKHHLAGWQAYHTPYPYRASYCARWYRSPLYTTEKGTISVSRIEVNISSPAMFFVFRPLAGFFFDIF